jgi:FKBP-type peptidyl-prolyl cis-trans isomerase FklB
MKGMLAGVSVLAICSCNAPSDKHVAELKTERERFSYAVGLNVGSNLWMDSVDLDYDAVLLGLKDSRLDTSEHLISQEDVQRVVMAVQQQVQARKQRNHEVMLARNKQASEDFLNENRKDPEVVVLRSGVQYKVLTKGTGKIPGAKANVLVKYTGCRMDGSEFDSSEKRGGTATINLHSTIPGWTDAVSRMPVGSRWKIFIPPDHAYGDEGSPGLIEPGLALVFDVELVGIR